MNTKESWKNFLLNTKNIDIDSIIELLVIGAELVPSFSFEEQICEDPDDDKFLACAITAKCKYIVSRDKHLLNIDNISMSTLSHQDTSLIMCFSQNAKYPIR